MEALKDYDLMRSGGRKMLHNATRRSIWSAVLISIVVVVYIFSSSTLHRPIQYVQEQTVSTATNAEVQSGNKSPPTIGKVTMFYGAWAQNTTFQQVLHGHRAHAELHGHGFYVLERPTMPQMYSKMAYILQIVLDELAKPEGERVEWLFWYDLDIVIMNKQIPLDIYLPPANDFKHVHLLVCNDENGMNSGAFFIRVNTWAAEVLMEALTFHVYKPTVNLRWGDQSAMENVIKDSKRIQNVVFVPQRWVNAYMGPRNSTKDGAIAAGEIATANTIMPGDLQVHFAGRYKQFIPRWLAFGSDEMAGWSIPLSQTTLANETATFWKEEKVRQDIAWEEEKLRRVKANEAKKKMELEAKAKFGA